MQMITIVDPLLWAIKISSSTVGAVFYSVFTGMKRKEQGKKSSFKLTILDFLSALFTGVLFGLFSALLSADVGVSVACFGTGALLGPRGLNVMLNKAAEKI